VRVRGVIEGYGGAAQCDFSNRLRQALTQPRRLASEPAQVSGRPRDVRELVAALELGIDAATGRALLEPFV
jgi:hypothetical protein